jgi:hypothetical protein
MDQKKHYTPLNTEESSSSSDILQAQVEKERPRTIIRALLTLTIILFLLCACQAAALYFQNSACDASFVSELSAITG